MVHSRPEINRVDWLALWILFSTWCSISGWSLSALGGLNVTGVCISAAGFIVVLVGLWRPLELMHKSTGRIFPRLRSRWVLPKLWLILAALELLGGLLYAPNNYDYLTYRFPRLLYWSWEQKWYWIPTINPRMNLSGTQFEWMMAPLFILFKTDRLFFLINFASYLFFPGLIYSVFNGLGLSRRISWWWMWILPTGYCFLLQAGSVGNDSFTAIYLLAALYFLFRARASGAVKNVVLSTLAIALMTGAKASNLPLVLPWAVLLYFTRDKALAKVTPVILVVTLLIAAGASFAPVAALNHYFTGDFFGDPTNRGRMKVDGPMGGIVGNLLQIGSQNVAPPLWYKSISWDAAVPSSIRPMLKQSFPRLSLGMEEFPIEESAGVGVGCFACAVVFLLLGLRARITKRTWVSTPRREAWWIAAATAMATLIYMSKIATEAAPRVVAPYYPLWIAGVLAIASLDGRVMGRRLFRWAGILVALSTFPMVILSPSRPLFPVKLVSDSVAKYMTPGMSERFRNVYTVYAARAFLFEAVTPLIPTDERAVGLMQNGDTAVASLWRPFGSRKVIEVTPDDGAEEMKARGIHRIILSQEAIGGGDQADIDTLLNKWSAHLIATRQLTLKVQQGSNTWYVIDLDK